MPSPRKRIGFLPREEVKSLIDKICKRNKLSQSKVTGILVEEALCNRGVLRSSEKDLLFDFDSKINNSSTINDDFLTESNDIYNEKFNLGLNFVNDDIVMIEEFIKYKLFKKIMSQNMKINNK